MSTFQIVALVFAGVIALIALIFVVTRLGISALGKAGGMGELMARYQSPAEPEGQRFERQSIQAGAVRWMRCATAVVSTRGLWLHMRPPLKRFPAMLIPWSEFRAGDPTRIAGLRAVRLEIGNPPIAKLAVCDDLFSAIKPHLG